MAAAFNYDLERKRIFVAGHRGMAGSALIRRLARENCQVLTADRATLNLQDQEAVRRFFNAEQPDVVIHAAAKVGGIGANSKFPVQFLCDNLKLELSVIEAAHAAGVERLLFLGSSCIYPKFAPQPITEDALLTGTLEPTNEWYAVAKIAGIKMCQAYRRQYGSDFISAMPTNLYGPGDNYHPDHSHVPAALIRRFHEAKLAGSSEVEVWGTGTPQREFMCVDDLADACIFLLKHYSSEAPINVGSGEEISIADFAQMVARTIGYQGRLVFDASKPDGTPRKLVDSSRLRALGWQPQVRLIDGLAAAYRDFLSSAFHNDRKASAPAQASVDDRRQS
jgi:GDP-L-fucose synthase